MLLLIVVLANHAGGGEGREGLGTAARGEGSRRDRRREGGNAQRQPGWRSRWLERRREGGLARLGELPRGRGKGGRKPSNADTRTEDQRKKGNKEKPLGETTPTNTSELSDLLREKSGVEQSKKVKEPRISLN